MTAKDARNTDFRNPGPPEARRSRVRWMARRPPARILIALGVSAVLLSGCGGMDMGRWLPSWGERAPSEAPRTPPGAKAYACDGGKRLLVRFAADNRYVMIIFPEREFRLDADASAPGARFSNGRTVLSVRADEAALEEAGTATFARCKIEAAS